MNTDIRLRLSFRNHPKTKKLAFKLGPAAPLNMIYLMMFAAESKPSGRLRGMDHDDIAIAAGYEGDPDEFVETLLAVRFLDRDEAGILVIHDWGENNPWAAGAEARKDQATKAAEARWKKEKRRATKNQTLTPKKNAQSTDEQCGEHGSAMRVAENSNAPSPSPSPKTKDQEQRPDARKSAPTPTAQGKRLADDWWPDTELLEWAGRKRPDLDLKETTEKFRDHFLAKPGKDGRKVRWDLTWKNWIRNENSPRSGGSGRQPPGETPADRNRKATEDYLRGRGGRAMAANE